MSYVLVMFCIDELCRGYTRVGRRDGLRRETRNKRQERRWIRVEDSCQCTLRVSMLMRIMVGHLVALDSGRLSASRQCFPSLVVNSHVQVASFLLHIHISIVIRSKSSAGQAASVQAVRHCFFPFKNMIVSRSSYTYSSTASYYTLELIGLGSSRSRQSHHLPR